MLKSISSLKYVSVFLGVRRCKHIKCKPKSLVHPKKKEKFVDIPNTPGCAHFANLVVCAIFNKIRFFNDISISHLYKYYVI